MNHYQNWNGVLCSILLSLVSISILAQSQSKFAIIPFGEINYFSLNDCKCPTEPIGGKPKNPVYTAGWGIETLLVRNVSLKVEMTAFRYSSKSSGIININHYDIWSTSTNHTQNNSIGVSLGFLSSSTVKVGPEIGFMAFRRTITGGTVTNYYYENSIDDPHAYSPGGIPDSIQTYDFSNGINWKANAITLGFNAWLPIKYNLYAFVNLRLMYLGNYSNWIDSYQHSWIFHGASVGIGFDILRESSERSKGT